MGEIHYAPVIQDMVWSYSRIQCFEECPYRWFLKYICGLKGKEQFFASYGSFMHKLIERHYTEGKTPAQLSDLYLCGFQNQVRGDAPNSRVFGSYFMSGLEYLRNFTPFPYRPLAVEGRVDFRLGGLPFVGYIDFLGERDGELYLVDNKSRNLKPRSSRPKPTKTDAELDEYLRQLYLYSIPVKEMFHQYPARLEFNCFRTRQLISEPFREEELERAKQWASDRISKIANNNDWPPKMDFWKCKHICAFHDECEYFAMNQ